MVRDRILQRAHELFYIHPRGITGRMRSKVAMPAKFAVCAALHRRGWSLCKIGSVVGRHHTTVMYALQQAKLKAEQDPEYAAKIDELANLIVEAPQELQRLAHEGAQDVR